MMRRKHYLGWMLAALFSVASVPDAAHAAEESKIPTLSQVLDASGVNLSGFIDTSATYNWNGTPNFTSGTSSRAYDVQPNSFNVQMMELALTKEPTEGLGGVLVLNAGPDANVDASYGTSSTNEFDFQQAYVSYTTGGAKLILGKFSTLIGAEVIESPQNWNFSRSWGFELGPYTHTGARLTYAPTDKIGFTIGVNNGWDIFKAAGRKQKSLEAQVNYTPADSVYLSLQATSGSEPAQGGYAAAGTIYGNRTLVNTVDSWDVNDKVSLMVDAGYGTQKKAISLAAGAPATAKTVKWWYITPYLNYHITSQWRIALRGQYFDDKDGFRTGVAQKLKAGTFTLAYAPSGTNSEIRAEYRYDKSNVKAFNSTKGNALPKNSQSSAALEFIYTM
ncbi:MAG TPA: outer membrane beta-barrel protein [Mariprofundaceae bacterium]|nr:outer membrane beta-barrel protein [Mariprofundaceae bacterium]